MAMLEQALGWRLVASFVLSSYLEFAFPAPPCRQERVGQVVIGGGRASLNRAVSVVVGGMVEAFR